MAHEAGKGDAPRKTRSDGAYHEGWERIFKKTKAKEPPSSSSSVEKGRKTSR